MKKRKQNRRRGGGNNSSKGKSRGKRRSKGPGERRTARPVFGGPELARLLAYLNLWDVLSNGCAMGGLPTVPRPMSGRERACQARLPGAPGSRSGSGEGGVGRGSTGAATPANHEPIYSFVRRYLAHHALAETSRRHFASTAEWPDFLRDWTPPTDPREVARHVGEDPAVVAGVILRTAARVYLGRDNENPFVVGADVEWPGWMFDALFECRSFYERKLLLRAKLQREPPTGSRPRPLEIEHSQDFYLFDSGVEAAFGDGGPARRIRAHLEAVANALEAELALLDRAVEGDLDRGAWGARLAFATMEYVGSLAGQARKGGALDDRWAGQWFIKHHLPALEGVEALLWVAVRHRLAHGSPTAGVRPSATDGRVLDAAVRWGVDDELLRRQSGPTGIEFNSRALLQLIGRAVRVVAQRVPAKGPELERWRERLRELHRPARMAGRPYHEVLEGLMDRGSRDAPATPTSVVAHLARAAAAQPPPIEPWELALCEAILDRRTRPTAEDLAGAVAEHTEAVARALRGLPRGWAWLPGELAVDRWSAASASERSTLPGDGTSRELAIVTEHLRRTSRELAAVRRHLVPLPAAYLLHEEVGAHWSMVALRAACSALDHLAQLLADEPVAKVGDSQLDTERIKVFANRIGSSGERYGRLWPFLRRMYRYPAFHLLGPRNVVLEAGDGEGESEPIAVSYVLIESEQGAPDLDFEAERLEHLAVTDSYRWTAIEGRGRVRIPARFIHLSPGRFLDDLCGAIERLVAELHGKRALVQQIVERLEALEQPIDARDGELRGQVLAILEDAKGGV